MVLSLVTVPAMADITVTGLSISGDDTAYPGQSKTYTVSGTPAIEGATGVSVTAWNWTETNGFTGSSTTSSYTGTANAVGTATIKCKVTVTYTPSEGEQITTEVELTKNVTVADKYELTVSPSTKTLYYNADATTEAAYKTVTLVPTLTKNGAAYTFATQDYVAPTYEYASSDTDVATVFNGLVTAVAAGSATITAKAKVGDTEVATITVTIRVKSRYSVDATTKTLEVYAGGTATLSQAKLEDALGGTVPKYTVSYAMKTDTDKNYATVNETTGVVTGVNETTGSTTAKVVATVKDATDNTKVYGTVEYSVTVKPVTVEIKLTGAANGDYVKIDDSDLETKVLSDLKGKLSGFTTSGKTVEDFFVTANNKTNGTLYKSSSMTDANKVVSTTDLTDADSYFAAKKGYIGETEYNFTVKVSGTPYNGKLTIGNLAADKIEETTIATPSSSSKYSFDLLSTYYDYVYYRSSLPTAEYDGDYSSAPASFGGWTRKAGGAELEISESSFNSKGEYTLYVVGVRGSSSNGYTAYAGTLTVLQETYEINYTGVVDEKVLFSQEDFEDLFEEMADDADDVTTGGTLTFNYATFSVPSSAKGALYDDGTKITKSSTKCEDMDDVYYLTSKTETLSINFTLYGEAKRTSSASKKNVSYDGVVNITIYDDGDITYEVDAGEFLEFDEDDFIDFYKDEKSGTLYSVTFGEPSKGTLYASYTSSKKNTDAADNTFYTDAKAGKDDYEIDDVLYLAETKPLTEYSVYIPFEAKGSKTSVSGTVEIIVNGKMPFTDVAEGSTFYEYIKYCYRNNIMQGKTTTLFKPAEPVTRAQFITTLYRMAGSKTTYNSNAMTFTDCKNLSTEFQNAIKWGVAKKLINGYGNSFKPNDSITRQAMVTILYRFGNNLGYIDGSDVLGNVNKFSDANKIAANMKEAVAWAVGAGLVSGNNGKFNPTGTTTRGACAKVLANFHETYVG